MFKVNNEDTRSTPLVYRSGVSIVNLEHISQLVLVCFLLTLNMQMLAGSKVAFVTIIIYDLIYFQYIVEI